MSDGEPPRRPAKRRKTFSNSNTDDMAAPSTNAHANAPDAVTPTANEPRSAVEDTITTISNNDSPSPDTNSMRDGVSDLAQNNSSRLTWPSQRVPVEIFNTIVRFLCRKDVQAMRLVNKEFDAKLAEGYFGVVVVPFRPEFEALYGSLNVDPIRNGDQQRLSLVIKKKEEVTASVDQQNQSKPVEDDSLLSDGHRVFQEFGKQMRKFALALELNEKDLAYPPLKINQEIISAPWGLYRWPIMNYQRYTKLEGLEQLADETGYMKDAFRFLSDITEMGISCDAGLGWLRGPDTNRYYTRSGPPVFRPVDYGHASNFDNKVSEEKGKPSLGLSILRQMALNAGYSADEWPEVILRLLEDEGREGAVQWTDRAAAHGNNVQTRVPKLIVDETTTAEDIIRHIETVITDEGDLPLANNIPEQRTHGLHPGSLTAAQAEMLLELEWAHRALIQSYRIAVLDNKDHFKNLSKLNIARLSACHVLTWCDDPFWENMTSIQTFHLGVIPDWRVITKDGTGAVTQRRVQPIHSYATVFRLLDEFVGLQKNIKTLSFEWVLGGEFALGKSQRDRYILPAPVLSNVSHMVAVQHVFEGDHILKLPHVSTLILKNCYFTPHIFLSFFQHMSLEALVEVHLESVSLTGPPSVHPELSIYPTSQRHPTHWPWPLCCGAEAGDHFQLQRPGQAVQQQAILGWMAAAAGIGVQAPGALAVQLAPPTLPGGIFGMNNAAVVNPFQAGHPGSAVPVNNTSLGPQPAPEGTDANQWRIWSWPHLLASLGMAVPSVMQELEDSDGPDHDHWRSIKSVEKRYTLKFKSVMEDRDSKGNHQRFKLKSCGYALIDSPNIDNWKIIPDHAIRVRQTTEFVNRLKDLDAQMLFTSDGMLGKILNYMPDEEQMQLRNVFDFDFGWEDLYDINVIRAAVEDGNPEPGEARFYGDTSNDPEALAVMEISRSSRQALSSSS